VKTCSSIISALIGVAVLSVSVHAQTAPGVPALSAEADGNVVTASWSPGPGGAPTSWIVYVGTSPGAADVYAQSVGLMTSGSGVLPPGTYYIRVAAVNSLGVVSSNELTLLVGGVIEGPEPPSGLLATVSDSTVSLSWTAPETGPIPTGYVIEVGSSLRANNVGSFSTADTSTNFVARGVPAGTYFVRIRARGLTGISAPSNEVIVAVGAAPGLLRFIEGAAGVPGDGRLVSAAGGRVPGEFELTSPLSLADITHGIHVWVFLPGGNTNVNNIGLQLEARRGTCDTGIGHSGAVPDGIVVVNGVTGVHAFAAQSTLQSILDDLNALFPECGFTPADLQIYALMVFHRPTPTGPTHALLLDAAAMVVPAMPPQ
jgi:hypothetical protein